MIIIHGHRPRPVISGIALAGIILASIAALILLSLLITAIYVNIEKHSGEQAADIFIDTCQCLTTTIVACCMMATSR